LRPNQLKYRKTHADILGGFLGIAGLAILIYLIVNYHYKRSGALFQGKFKSVRIRTNAHLLYLSAYVNKNYFIHGYGDDFDWPYSSFLDYTGKRNGGICDTGVILNEFKNKNEYREFIKENSLYMKEKKEREKYLLE